MGGSELIKVFVMAQGVTIDKVSKHRKQQGICSLAWQFHNHVTISFCLYFEIAIPN